MIWQNIIKPLLVLIGILKKEEEKVMDKTELPTPKKEEVIEKQDQEQNQNQDKNKKDPPTEVIDKEAIEVVIEIVEEVAKSKNPNQDKVVIFRNGHGLNTAGKETPLLDDGTIIKEYQLNKWITQKAIPMLEHLGYECVIANPYDYEDPNHIKALNIVIGHINQITRQMEAKGKKVICIDVHCNAHQPNKNKIEWTSASGTVSFFWQKTTKDKEGKEKIQYSQEGKKLTIAVHKEMVKLTGLPDRAWSYNRGQAVGWNFMILRKTFCPTVTVECAFMTNRGDLAFLMSEEGQYKCAKAIATGVNNYFWE